MKKGTTGSWSANIIKYQKNCGGYHETFTEKLSAMDDSYHLR